MGKRYYWFKLREDFFRQLAIKKLRKIAGGDTYTIIYLKMMLLAMQSDGVLGYECAENEFAENLAIDMDEEIDNVQVTLSFLLKNELVAPCGDGDVLLPEVVKNTGSESVSAERVRTFRERKALQCNTSVTPMLRTGNKNVTLEKEIEIDKEKEKDIPKGISKKKSSHKHKYGQYGNVLLSDEELEKLKAEFPFDWEERIERLSEYVASTGKVYKNFLATIRSWSKKDCKGVGNHGDTGKNVAATGEFAEFNKFV